MIPLWYACAEFNKNVTDFLLREPHSTTALIQDKVVFSLSSFSVGDLDPRVTFQRSMPKYLYLQKNCL